MRLSFERVAARLPWSTFALVPLVAGLAVTAGCGAGETSRTPGAKLQVAATTVQVGALAGEVGGDLIDLTTLIGPGIDPHDFSPSPDDLKRIAAADVLLRSGLGLDEWLDETIKSAGGNGEVVTVTDGIRLREVGDESHRDEPKATDPHVWHDPENDKIMIDRIVSALAKFDPENAEVFKKNGEVAKQRFDDVDRQIRTLVDSIPEANRKMVTDHDAFGYFIDRYGLTFVGAVIPGTTTQSEPSAKDIAELEAVIRREGVKAVFSEGSVDPKVAKQVAADTGIRIVDNLYGDSLGEPGSPEETLAGVLLFNARLIAEALK